MFIYLHYNTMQTAFSVDLHCDHLYRFISTPCIISLVGHTNHIFYVAELRLLARNSNWQTVQQQASKIHTWINGRGLSCDVHVSERVPSYSVELSI